MSQFFTLPDAGRRYDQYRPRVHGVVLDWLAPFIDQEGQSRPFKRAIDVACGTGHSSLPLREVSEELICIDTSEEMLAFARAKGLPTRLLSYVDMPTLGRFDLISTCMAFHWFDPDLAIKAYKGASRPGALWLIYNFGFAGHTTNTQFNEWFQHQYVVQNPAPPRAKTAEFAPPNDPAIEQVAHNKGWLPVTFTHESLIGYLATQSNVENQLRQGADLAVIQQTLRHKLAAFDLSGPFEYAYRYELYRFQPQ